LARRNAEPSRSGRTSEADLEHIAEEIDAMAKRERRALYRILEHLLKWQYQPERRRTSWQKMLLEQRSAAQKILEDNPSFRRGLAELVIEAYPTAPKASALVIGRERKDSPAECPYSVDQVLDQEYLPGP
jgi:hypothetical protein